MPSSCWSLRISARTWTRIFASRLDSGSSRSRMSGLSTSARASATRCCNLVVRDVDRGDAELLLELADLRPHLDADLRVEVGQRLVEEQDVRVEHERACERDPLLLAAGELARIAVLEPGEIHLPESLGEPPSDRGAVELPEPEAVSDVGARGHVGPERVVLEDHADVTLVGSQLVHAALAEPDLAGVGCPKARDEAEQRRLAAAGRPEQCEELAVGDLERNPVDGGHAVEALRDTAQRDVHWTGVRETGPLRGWPETRCVLTSPFTPPESTVLAVARAAARLRLLPDRFDFRAEPRLERVGALLGDALVVDVGDLAVEVGAHAARELDGHLRVGAGRALDLVPGRDREEPALREDLLPALGEQELDEGARRLGVARSGEDGHRLGRHEGVLRRHEL